ncbi:MAG TPA: histidine kinase dimerization/phospho-acceptor domain-containing protein [Bacillota bacterium]|nr:histidine kinase dimerization/phospho-acceptor domain-containing protein [Bacillota bacterium]
MIYLTVIAIFCAIIFFILWLILSCQLKRMTYQLKENTEKDLDTKISISLLYERLSNLTQKINNLIEQKQIVQAAQLSSERELKGAISSMSHDLRTPLTAIIGYIQLAKQDDLSTDKRDEYLTVAKERSFQLQRLIQNFFSLSVVESSEYLLNMKKLV